MDSPSHNPSLGDFLRWAGEPPPEGLWSEEVQRRCFCFREYLQNHISQNHGLLLDLTVVIRTMSKQCSEEWNDDWLSLCAHLYEGARLPEELEAYRLSFEAACRYLVFGDYEHLYVSKEKLDESYLHIKRFLKQWLIGQL